MPTYCYSNEDGAYEERVFYSGSAPDKIRDASGNILNRDRQAELAGQHIAVRKQSKPPRGNNCWPMTCYASGVHPNQASDLRKLLKDNGVPTEVTKGGDPIYTSEKHKRKALKVRGFHDKNSFV